MGARRVSLCDLVTLARDQAICTAYVLRGDEDIRAGVTEAQAHAVSVVLLGIPPSAGQGQSPTLIHEADDHLLLDRPLWAQYIAPITPTVAPSPQASIGVAAAVQASPSPSPLTHHPKRPLESGAKRPSTNVPPKRSDWISPRNGLRTRLPKRCLHCCGRAHAFPSHWMLPYFAKLK